MFTSLVQLPTSVKETLISLENRNRLIEDFVIASVLNGILEKKLQTITGEVWNNWLGDSLTPCKHKAIAY